MKKLSFYVIILMLIFPFLVLAANETFTIYDYNKPNVIKDSNGNTVEGYVYCLDSKETPPTDSGTTYQRTSLTDYSGYSKEHGSKTFNEKMKKRLVKVIVASDQIKQYSRTLYNSSKVQDAIVWANANYFGAASIDEIKANMQELYNDPIQALIWLFVHDDADWINFIEDDGTQSYSHGKQDNYFTKELETYTYVSSNAMNDPNSLWNIFYAPLIDYIDNQITDYYSLGYDAWIYYINQNSMQNMIAAAPYSSYIKIAKIDEDTNAYLANAHLQLIDSDNNIIDEWDSTTTPHQSQQKISSGKTYTIRETRTPNGYTSINDVTFTIGLNTQVSDNARLQNGIILIPNKKEVRPEEPDEPEPPKYEITKNNEDCCEISIEKDDLKNIEANEIVKFKLLPAETTDEYSITLVIQDKDGKNITYEQTGVQNEYKFTMPANDVNINLTCEKEDKPEEPPVETPEDPETPPEDTPEPQTEIPDVPQTGMNIPTIYLVFMISLFFIGGYFIYIASKAKV